MCIYFTIKICRLFHLILRLVIKQFYNQMVVLGKRKVVL